MDTTSTAGRGIDAEDIDQVQEVEHVLHATIYRMMERDRKAHDGDLTEMWHKLHSVQIRVGEVGAALIEVEALVLNPPKAEEAEKGAGLGNMIEVESALYTRSRRRGTDMDTIEAYRYLDEYMHAACLGDIEGAIQGTTSEELLTLLGILSQPWPITPDQLDGWLEYRGYRQSEHLPSGPTGPHHDITGLRAV